VRLPRLTTRGVLPKKPVLLPEPYTRLLALAPLAQFQVSPLALPIVGLVERKLPSVEPATGKMVSAYPATQKDSAKPARTVYLFMETSVVLEGTFVPGISRISYSPY
jgi:hypothetical protein